jgi:hypothetical protein
MSVVWLTERNQSTGSEAAVWKYDGGLWLRTVLPVGDTYTAGTLRPVHGTSYNDVWVGGQEKTNLYIYIAHSNGIEWSSVPLTDLPSVVRVAGIYCNEILAVSPTEVYFMCENSAGSIVYIVKYNGSTYDLISGNLGSSSPYGGHCNLTRRSNGDIYTILWDGFYRPNVYYYNGSSWSTHQVTSTTSTHWYSIVGDDSGNIYFRTNYTHATAPFNRIMKGAETSWSEAFTPTKNKTGISYSVPSYKIMDNVGDNIYMITTELSGNGLFVWYNATTDTWGETSFSHETKAAMCSVSDTEHYAAMYKGVVKFSSQDGSSNTKLEPTGQGAAQDYSAVWAYEATPPAIPERGTHRGIYVGGELSKIYRLLDGTWTDMGFPVSDCTNVYSIWSYDDNNVWAVATEGIGSSSSKAKVYYYNGSTWTLQLDLPIGFWGRVAPCNLHGSSPNDVWLVGWRPLYGYHTRHFHFNGSYWSPVTIAPEKQLTQVHVTSESDVAFSGSWGEAYFTPSYTGPASFTPYPSQESIGIARREDGDYVVACDSGAGIYVGNESGFTRVVVPADSTYSGSMARQHCGGWDDEFYVFWSNGKFHYYNGNTWNELDAYHAVSKPDGVASARAVVVQNNTAVWVCGASGQVCRYNPSSDTYLEYNNPLGFGSQLFTIWTVADPVPAPSTASIDNVFVVAKDVIRVEFTAALSASKHFWKTSSYSITDVSGQTLVEVKEVRPVYEKATTYIYLKVNGFKWGNTYSIAVADELLCDISGNLLPADSKEFGVERTKADSMMATFSNIYDIKPGTNIRSIIEAISIVDEKIGGNF